MAKTSITLDRKSLEAVVAEATKVRAQLTEAAGTMGAIMGKASAKVKAAPIGEVVHIEIPADTTWEEALAAIEARRAGVQERFDKAVQEAAGSHIKTHQSKTTGLTTRLEALVTQATAMHGLLSSMGVDVKGIEIPSAKVGAKRASSNGGSSGGKATHEYYKVEDGQTVVLSSDHRTKLGSIAWYWFGQCGTENLRTAMAAAKVTPGETFAPVPVTAGGKTVTLGCRPIPTT